MFENQPNISNQNIDLEPFFSSKTSVSIKREDKIDSFVSGNKFRKLKYNLLEAKRQGYDTILTFGGAYSNHIAAVASAGNSGEFKTIGIIRGEELLDKIQGNPTLLYATENNMQLHFAARPDYSRKNNPDLIQSLEKKFGKFYLLPEGGTNVLAVKGCAEILIEADQDFDYICTSVGTGGTIAGLVEGSLPHQTVFGFSALKGNFQHEIVKKYTSKTNFEITDAYCFGGYAKIDSELIRFMNEFKATTGIPLDPIYTGKMMFGIMDLLKKGYFKENSRILAIHTGGLQGISGMNQLLKKKNLPQINL